MISTPIFGRYWLRCYLLRPELITGTPPQQFNTAIITRLGVRDSCGLQCPLWVISGPSTSYQLSGRYCVYSGHSIMIF